MLLKHTNPEETVEHRINKYIKYIENTHEKVITELLYKIAVITLKLLEKSKLFTKFSRYNIKNKKIKKYDYMKLTNIKAFQEINVMFYLSSNIPMICQPND